MITHFVQTPIQYDETFSINYFYFQHADGADSRLHRIKAIDHTNPEINEAQHTRRILRHSEAVGQLLNVSGRQLQWKSRREEFGNVSNTME